MTEDTIQGPEPGLLPLPVFDRQRHSVYTHPSFGALYNELQVRAFLIDYAAACVRGMEARKDAAYLERNQVVAALAKAFPSGVARTAIEGWSEDWHGCVYVDLPTGQASWHFHDSQANLFDGLPQYHGDWDGHTTEEKYRRLAALQVAPAQAIAEVRTTPTGWVQLVVRGVVVAGRSPRSTYPDLDAMARRINEGAELPPSPARTVAKAAIAPWAEDTARVWAEQAISTAASFGLALTVVDGVATFQPEAEPA